MEYKELSTVLSPQRMGRYLNACQGNTKKAQVLYRLNIKLSQEMFSVIGCFEIALRNAIDIVMTNALGKDWLRDAIMPGGIFDVPQMKRTAKILSSAYQELLNAESYSPSKMLSSMRFGIWKYMYSSTQYRATGRRLLSVFPKKPKSSNNAQYNNLFIFNELDAINRVRNRIAHHEPICFLHNNVIISTVYLINCYFRILRLFSWMDIDASSLLYGLDHVNKVAKQINTLSKTIFLPE